MDCVGTAIELIPNLTGANGRSTGRRGLFLWLRTGSDVVVPNAFRMLDVPDTADPRLRPEPSVPTSSAFGWTPRDPLTRVS